MRTIGIIGGTSWESTAVYYRLLNEGVRDRVGGLSSAPLLLASVDFAPLAELMGQGRWDDVGGCLAEAGQRLQRGGAECVVLASNTLHKMSDAIKARVNLPYLHVVDALAPAIAAAASKKPLLLATAYTMEQPFYRADLERRGVTSLVPDEADRADMHRIIFDELCRGVVSPASKQRVIAMVHRSGADGVIFGCTEIGMLLSQDDFTLPVFDTTVLHVGAALDFALETTS